MATYMVSVSKEGSFLFRTEEQPCDIKYIHNMRRDPVVAALIEKFPASEGYKVDLVIWPNKRGSMINVTKNGEEVLTEIDASVIAP